MNPHVKGLGDSHPMLGTFVATSILFRVRRPHHELTRRDQRQLHANRVGQRLWCVLLQISNGPLISPRRGGGLGFVKLAGNVLLSSQTGEVVEPDQCDRPIAVAVLALQALQQIMHEHAMLKSASSIEIWFGPQLAKSIIPSGGFLLGAGKLAQTAWKGHAPPPDRHQVVAAGIDQSSLSVARLLAKRS